MGVRVPLTALERGPMGRHAPGAALPALGHHDGEFIQRVGLQARRHVAEGGRVCSLEKGM